MRRSYVVFIILSTIFFVSAAQRRLRSKYEWVYGLGSTAFLGDLGGADQEGTNFIKDYEFSTTRPVFTGGMRRRLSGFSSIKANAFYGFVTGADKLTNEPFRKNRNLSFRSPVFELSGQYELFIKKEKQGALYKIKNARGTKKGFDIQVYALGGGGIFFFNPKAKSRITGRWENLQPLSTEGQGLPGGPKKYYRVNFALLYGFGFKYGIDRKMSLGLEFGFRKTFTDYLDDVSTVYYDNDALRKAKGNIAAELGDPSLDKSMTTPNGDGTGAQRGDPKKKDSYAFATVTINYKLLYKRKTRSKF